MPIAGTGITYRATIVTSGSPFTILETSATVAGVTVDVYVCFRRGSSSTAPAQLIVDVTGGALASGQYTLRLLRSTQPTPQDPCPAPGLVHEQQMLVVSAAQAVTVVEYFNAPRNHYFQTSDPVEIAALDTGYYSGWARTGQSYRVYSGDVAQQSSAVAPVCRYYGKPEAGLDTHFFSGFVFECSIVPILWPNQWILESGNAYAAALPAENDGACPSGPIPIYRLFNNKSDVNHRYTKSLVIREQMLQQGWIAEGYGSIGIALCAEQD